MKYADVRMTERGLERLQDFLKGKEESDRRLLEYYKEHGMTDFEPIEERIKESLLARGKIVEVFDILDTLEIKE